MRELVFALSAIGVIACSAASTGVPLKPDISELDPNAYCAKLAGWTAASRVKLPCKYFVPLYVATQKDNPAYFRCSARCVDQSDDIESFGACEKRERCVERTSTPAPRSASGDARLESYCRQMVAINDPIAKPRLGMWSCATIATWMKTETPSTFDCSYDCAFQSTSQAAYQECIRQRSCDSHR